MAADGMFVPRVEREATTIDSIRCSRSCSGSSSAARDPDPPASSIDAPPSGSSSTTEASKRSNTSSLRATTRWPTNSWSTPSDRSTSGRIDAISIVWLDGNAGRRDRRVARSGHRSLGGALAGREPRRHAMVGVLLRTRRPTTTRARSRLDGVLAVYDAVNGAALSSGMPTGRPSSEGVRRIESIRSTRSSRRGRSVSRATSEIRPVAVERCAFVVSAPVLLPDVSALSVLAGALDADGQSRRRGGRGRSGGRAGGASTVNPISPACSTCWW